MTLEEMKVPLGQLNLTNNQIDVVMTKLDKDTDGKVTKKEMLESEMA
jgi:hypothetical protein